jgi:anti-sigma regulatory factor (Ser/Thr protein kinase)
MFMAQITVPARLDCLTAVLEFTGAAMDGAGMERKQQNNIKIAVEEIFVNIVSYAYPAEVGDVTVSISFSPDKLALEFADCGAPYDPLSKADPDTSLSADERAIGGLGVYMVKNIMDAVQYRYENNQNILRLEKFLV